MPTGIEIASLVLATTGMGGSAANKLANYASKGAADKTYDQVMEKYMQMKQLREDDVINRYLSDIDKERLDESIEMIAFDLMTLQTRLQELRGTAYYRIKTYPAKWLQFKDRTELTLKQIVEVTIDIENRSTQGRAKNKLSGKVSTTVSEADQPSQPSDNDKPVVVNKGSASGDSLAVNRQIAEAMASSAVQALRASFEGGLTLASPMSAEGGNEQSGSGLSIDTAMVSKLQPGLKWEISPKSTPLPPSLSGMEDIELDALAEEVE